MEVGRAVGAVFPGMLFEPIKPDQDFSVVEKTPDIVARFAPINSVSYPPPSYIYACVNIRSSTFRGF
jgi:hypothetical protein